MEYPIRSYVDDLFQDVPDSQRAYEMKVELIQNLLDKYNDLVASGKSEEDAYNITIYGIGDISELLDERRRQETENRSAQFGETYYEALTYFKRRSAAFVAGGAMLCVFSVIPVIVLSVISLLTDLKFLIGIGVAVMLFFVGIAVALFVWNESTKPKSEDPPEMIMDLFERRKSKVQTFIKIFDASYWSVLVAAYLLISFLTGRWDITWIMFIAGPAVSAIVHTAAKNKE